MQARDRLHQREAEAAACGRAAAVEAIEPVEDLFVLGAGDTRAVVGHDEIEPVTDLRQAERKLGAGGRVAQRVFQEVRDQLGEELAIARQRDAGLDADVEQMVAILGDRFVGFAQTGEKRREVDFCEARLLGAGLDLGDAQQGGEGLEQRIGFLDGGIGGCFVIRGRGGTLTGILEALAQAAALLAFDALDASPDDQSVYYFAGIDAARFKRPVEPGDQLLLEVELLRMKAGIFKFKTRASVAGETAVEAELTCAMRSIAPKE